MVPPATRSGQSLGLTLRLDTGGLPLANLECEQHSVRVDSTQAGAGRATITLARRDEIPNRDFVLHYRVGGAGIRNALFTYQPPQTRDKGNTDPFFSLLVAPPTRTRTNEIVPKEMVFVIDCSGSMGGFPLEKAKETMRQAILNMNPADTFNLISFAGGTGKCFARPVSNTPDNRNKALQYLSGLNGGGGTEMLPAIQEALAGAGDNRLRILCFMSDGFVGNEGEIIREIQKAQNARVFAFGIGTSVNRFLISAMAQAGNGAAEFVTLEADSGRAVERFRKRIQSPVLTDVSLDFNGLPVYDVYPKRLPDLFDAAPVVVFGRIRASAMGTRGSTVVLRGHTPSGAFARPVRITGQAGNVAEGFGNDALQSLWARAKVDDLMARDPLAWQGGNGYSRDIQNAVTKLGVQYSLMTAFTSFVAVEDKSYTGDATPTTVNVPVETPEGVSAEGAGNAPVFVTKRLYGVRGSFADASVPNPTFSAQPGDPLIRITDAPNDTRLIVAVLPDGTTIPLVKDARTGAYEAHFDIPLSAAEGVYNVRVILVRASGIRRTLTLHYRVDKTGAAGLGHIVRESDGTCLLEIETDEEAARVTALLPGGERLELTRVSEAGTRYTARLRAELVPADARITFVITDRAHNRTTITVDGGQ